MFYENAAWGSLTRRDRLQALSTLVQYYKPGSQKPDKPCVIVAPLRAVMTRTIPRREFILSSKNIRLGSRENPETLRRLFARLGYETVDVVTEHGHYSHRGGILDVWPPAEPFPVRMEFFGNELDTLRYFDPTTQRTVRALESIQITPAREFIVPEDTLRQDGKKEADEFFIPVFHPNAATILDFLPDDAFIVLDSSLNIQSFGEEIEEQALKNRADYVREGILPPDFPIPYMSWSEVLETINNRRWMDMVRPFSEESESLGARFIPGMRFAGQLKHFVTYLENSCRSGDISVIISRQVQRLKEIWEERDNVCEYQSHPRFLDGTLGEGWDFLLDDGRVIHCITDGEIFGWERPAPRARVLVKHASPDPILLICTLVIGWCTWITALANSPVWSGASWMGWKENFYWLNTREEIRSLSRSIRQTGSVAILGRVANRPNPLVLAPVNGARLNSLYGRMSSRWRRTFWTYTRGGKQCRDTHLDRTHPGRRNWRRVSRMWKLKIN